MIGICDDCKKEKGIHGNGLCNACHQKDWRLKHKTEAIPGKAERERLGKVRKIANTILDQYDKGVDLNQSVPGTVPDDLLESLKIVGDTLYGRYRGGVTAPAMAEEDDENGDIDDAIDAGDALAENHRTPATPLFHRHQRNRIRPG